MNTYSATSNATPFDVGGTSGFGGLTLLPLFPTTIAGSLPKPAWLAEPEKLWAPWKL